ncbi:MAG: sugar phosphate isomerase/epimerase [Dehalococcoidia bacterium]|nr:sugar phosphate isomerase/epimerase [Dehalococcoidia bacterium]
MTTNPPASPVPALSTMWAVQPRFEGDLPAFLERAGELGFAGVEVNHSMDAAQVGAILGRVALGGVRVTGVHAPAPLRSVPGRGENRALNLASTDEEERALAVADHLVSVDLAAEAGAQVVVVHLGGVGATMLAGERRLRGMYERRELLASEWDAAIDETVRDRAAQAGPWLEAARRSVEELAERASARGVTIGLETRLGYHEIPLPGELRDLLAPYPSEIAGYVHDVGHAEVQHRLGLTDRSAWWDEVGPRLVGLHLHDVRGLTDHRAPGNGDVDFRWLADRIAAANPSAARTFEVDQHETDEDLAAGLRLLIEAGVVPDSRG